ncbi:MAG: hypothetical protein Q7U35_06960 [Methanobacteriaceae archaeon]|nr:hypothetical protein [Methanobacteriaceae archaeon]MDP2836923.1 hypothetical protein [Methanobacteriaceae archaeon]MDP3033632.1 hypothetical protein [Methanobacteriaceae archaeon]MDP3483891.1 hypothetical protein [Methanobacteriaceae archaeon]MDP3623409.1 hypothetical protein [Methanobacteriaceae archaeon]
MKNKVKKTIYFSKNRINLPPGWSFWKINKIGPFITRVILKNPEEKLIYWESREARKHHFTLDKSSGSTWWAPGAIGWWIGILFAIGALFFGLGSFPPYHSLVGNFYNCLTFFIGSLFFTSAAFLQYLETINSPHQPPGQKFKENFHLLSLEPRRIDWWSSVVQLIGTLFFNMNTLESMHESLSMSQIDHMVWYPDIFGPICFLIASGLVWIEVGHSLLSWNPHSISWRIAFLNLLGSMAFGLSAISAYVMPATGLPKNEFLVASGTFIGAVCFFIAAILLLPERTHENEMVT